MEAPMSEWFRPVPSALDAVIYSVKVSTFKRVPSKANMPCQFQQEMMAAQIMSLRLRCQQQRVVIDRLKTENLELKKYCLGHLTWLLRIQCATTADSMKN